VLASVEPPQWIFPTVELREGELVVARDGGAINLVLEEVLLRWRLMEQRLRRRRLGKTRYRGWRMGKRDLCDGHRSDAIVEWTMSDPVNGAMYPGMPYRELEGGWLGPAGSYPAGDAIQAAMW
jgi:hypothetical protein